MRIKGFPAVALQALGFMEAAATLAEAWEEAVEAARVVALKSWETADFCIVKMGRVDVWCDLIKVMLDKVEECRMNIERI